MSLDEVVEAMDSLHVVPAEGAAAHSPLGPASTTRVSGQDQPSTRLPAELLFEVLKIACLGDGNSSYCDPNRVILLSGVCSYWRKTMLEDPSLWNQILFGETEGSLKVGLLCLERSQGLLLDITVHAIDLPTVNILSSHSSRVLTISIRSPDRNCIDLMLGYLPNKSVLSSLKNIWLDHTGFEDFDNRVSGDLFPGFLLHGDYMRTPLTILSSLHTLKLHGVRFDKYPALFSFDQLQTLELGRCCTIGDFRRILSIAPNLRAIKLYRLAFNYSRSTPMPSLAMLTFPPTLKKLTLSGIQTSILRNLIKCIPQGEYELVLEVIVQNMIPPLYQETFGQGGPDDYINGLMHTLSGALIISTLVIATSHYLNGSHIRTLLSCVPHARALVLKGLHLDREQLLVMTVSQLHGAPTTPAVSFPAFSRLELHECKMDDLEAFYTLITNHPIKELFVYRSKMLQSEEYVEIRSPSSFPENIATWLSQTAPSLSCTIINS